jgi:exonuclease SbcD
MRILHTADWHLGDRLGRQDRTDDLGRAVERVAGLCADGRVDVLLVAGDLFSELAGPDGLREAVRHLQETFAGFLRDGGTVLTLTGNHDKETFCQTLRHAMRLAAPAGGQAGELVPAGRLYLATGPTLLRLGDRDGGREVQFVLMPYPTTARYLADEAAQRYQGLDERNRALMAAYTHKLNQLRTHERFDKSLPTVLSAHVAVRGSELPTLFRLSEQEDVVLAEADLPTGFAYVALGHIHKAQALGGQSHVRYCGSIERLDLGEQHDAKGVVLLEVGAEGLRGPPEIVPMDAARVYEVTVDSPQFDVPELRRKYPDAHNDLVKLRVRYTAGVDDREALLRELEEIFPRWYDREIVETSELGPTLTRGEAAHGKSFEETVREYLMQELSNHEAGQRDAVLARAEALLAEVEA